MVSKENEMISFVHMSDLHLRQSPDTMVHGINPYNQLLDIIESIRRLEYKPKFVLITGDLIELGCVEGYHQLKQCTDSLEEDGIPTLFTLGNCDDIESLKKVYPIQETKTLNYVTSIAGLRIIVLDSSVPGWSIGRFTMEQLKWFKDALHKDRDKPTIIAFHHGINLRQVSSLNIDYDEAQRQEFYNIIAGCNILAVLNGHAHYNRITLVNGVLHCMAASTVSDFSFNDDEFWIRNRSSYNYLTYRNNSLHIKTISLPCDGRIITNAPLQVIIEEHLKPHPTGARDKVV